MLMENLHGFFHRMKTNMLKKLLLRVSQMCLSYFPFHSELDYRQNLFTASLC